MNVFFLFIASILCGLSGSYLIILGIRLCIKNKLSYKDKSRTTSLNELDKILSISRSRVIREAEKERIWSQGMNYIMNTKSENKAHAYAERIKKILGEDGQPFSEATQRVLDDRFHKK